MVHDSRSTVLDVDGDSKEQLSDIVINLGVTLPAWFMWPNLSTGNWKDCYADPDKICLLFGARGSDRVVIVGGVARVLCHHQYHLLVGL